MNAAYSDISESCSVVMLGIGKADATKIWSSSSLGSTGNSSSRLWNAVYTAPKVQWASSMGKAAEMEFPLILPGVALTWGSKWKASRAAEWEELVEGTLLTTTYNPSMEQLWEMFGRMETRGAAPMKSPTWRVDLGAGQASPPHPFLRPNQWCWGICGKEQ